MERDPRSRRDHGEFEQVDARGLETESVGTQVRETPQPVRHGPQVVDRRDSVRWGPIWAGLIAALTTFLLLELLAFGLGLLTPNVTPGPDNTVSAWVSGIIGLIAFFTGGAVAGMTSTVRGTMTGLLNGFLVWALGTVLILLLSALGLGQLFGTLGNVVGQLSLLQGGLNVPNNPNIDPQQVVQAVRSGALGAFFGLLLSALASALGGWLGGRTDHPIGHVTDPDRD